MASFDDFNFNETEWLVPAYQAEERDRPAVTTRPITNMSDVIDGGSYVSSSASIPTQVSSDDTLARTGQSRRRSDQTRLHRLGGVGKTRTSRPRWPISPNTLTGQHALATFAAYGQKETPAPPSYGSHASEGMYGSQLEIPVASQGPDSRQLEQPFESFQSFGTTDNAYNWNEGTLAPADNTFGGLQGSIVAAQSAIAPTSCYTRPGSFETPVHPGSGRVMVKLWRNLQAEHSWFFQIGTDEFEIKFHHTPSTIQTAGIPAIKKNWQRLADYESPISREVIGSIGDSHPFNRQIPLFGRLLEETTISSLLGPAAVRTINTDVSSLIGKLELAQFMSHDKYLSASWKEKHRQATCDVVAKLHDWTLSLIVAFQLVPSQDALTNRKMVSYKRLTPGEISRIFENLRQPEATVVYLPGGQPQQNVIRS